MSRSTNNKMSRTLVRNHVSRLQHSVGLHRIGVGGGISSSPKIYTPPEKLHSLQDQYLSILWYDHSPSGSEEDQLINHYLSCCVHICFRQCLCIWWGTVRCCLQLHFINNDYAPRKDNSTCICLVVLNCSAADTKIFINFNKTRWLRESRPARQVNGRAKT